MKENGFKLTKERRRYPAQRNTDADYADDIALLANAPAQAKTQLHSLERAAAVIDFHVNAHKTEYMCFNQTGDISTLNGSSLKLVDKFPYLGSSVSSTETDINTRLAKVWTAIDSLLVIWNSDLNDKKPSFFQAAGVSIMDASYTHGEKAWRQLHMNDASNIEQVIEAALHKEAAVRPPTTHHENYKS